MGHVIAFANHKGGVAKTTTVTNTAFGLMKAKKRVLVIDCDPQGNASMTLGTVSPFEQQLTIENLFTDPNVDFSRCAVRSKYEGIDLIASNINASAMASALGPSDAKRFICLKNKYDEKAQAKYDFILIDCPPTLEGAFLMNAMAVADFYVVPIEAESMYALQGVDSLLTAVKVMTEYTNKSLKLLGAVVTMFDSRTTAGRVMVEGIRSYFGNKRVFQTTIHRNTAVNKANMLFKCACDFDPKSAGCHDYRDLAKEIIARIENWNEFA